LVIKSSCFNKSPSAHELDDPLRGI
jgi:hypothetical protein